MSSLVYSPLKLATKVKFELLRDRFIEAKLPQVFLLDIILAQLSNLEVTK